MGAFIFAASYCIAALAAVGAATWAARALVRRNVVPSSLRGSGRRFVWLAFIGAAALAYGIWQQRAVAYYYVAAIEDCRRGGDPDPQWAEDALVRMGPRAIDPILSRIGGHNLQRRGTCLLVFPLKRLGVAAHERLLDAVDADNSRLHRVGYIIALHEAFKDDSRVHLWIQDVAFYYSTDSSLPYFLRTISPDVPEIFGKNGVVSSRFIKWCERQSQLGRIQMPEFGLLASISE